MGYFSCNADSAIATCDPHYGDLNKTTTTTTTRTIRKFNYSDLVAGSNSFSDENFLGKGSHGRVYKCTLDGGKLIAAVKTTNLTTNTTTTSGHHITTPEENEIDILSHINCSQIVNLIGFSTDPNGNKLIVVQYMPNGSLHDVLHSPVQPPGWAERIRFALQVAKAVLTLHSCNPPIIHRDVKSSNVLIDGDRNARLGDFGLSLRGHVEDVRVKCTPPAGTLGYLDPCYLEPDDLSAKTDVFSFGILLLEILSGRKAIDLKYSPPSVVDWAVPLIKQGQFRDICDCRIGVPADASVLSHLALLAARCVRSTADRRPSMEKVVEIVKTVRKRIGSVVAWSGFGVFECGGVDWSEEAVRVVKGGNRRRNGKVSSVGGVDYQIGPSSVQVSPVVIGSGSIMKSGSDHNTDVNPNRIEIKKGNKRLKKSKSMDFLPGTTTLLHYGSENIYMSDPIHSIEMAISKLDITHNLEDKMV